MAHDDKLNLSLSKVKAFCEERDWDQFHDAKELAIALSIEASELLELFRWKSPEEVRAVMADEARSKKVEQEMADVFFFLLRMAQLYDIDLGNALQEKIRDNEARYPAEKFKGSNRKYSDPE